MEKLLRFLVILVLYLSCVLCQENAGNTVARSLTDCYNNTAIPSITTANERPPATMNILIEYIRKLEDANPTMSPAQLSYQIMQRIRQDGIARTGRSVVDDSMGIPFAATRVERYRFQVLLINLLPNVEQTLNYGDLSSLEHCSLHYMISNTIDELRRENEATECPRSSRYTSRILNRRRRRDADTENLDAEPINLDSSTSARLSSNRSQCPIELGVVYNQFGTIKTGDVLAGIAAGLNQQTLQSGLVDNRYAATLVGELCKASLKEVGQTVTLGASGGWNSTINPKYYFLQNNNLQATDAELRGALDGLYMGLKMSSWTSTFSDLKISQILDMYYSPYEIGVFDNSFRACNRNILYTEMTSGETLRSQLLNFMPYLSSAAIGGWSPSNSSLEVLSNAGVAAFETFLPTLASSDLSCSTGAQSIERVATDLLIFIDSGWLFTSVQPVLSYVLNNIDVNKFGTRYTLFGGTSLRNLTSSGTRYLSDFYTQYNQTVHTNETTGFDYIRIFQTVESIGYEKLNNNTYTAGESTVVLFIPRTTLTEEQRTFLSQRKEVINRSLPDINFLVLGSGSQIDYNTIVSNTNKDVVIFQESTNEETLKTFGQQLVKNIRDVPRALVNPSCTSQYTGGASTFSVTEYVEPQGSNYYRISPNYFAAGGDTRTLRIREQGYGTINVCISRDNSRPDNSSTTSTCQSVASSDYSIEITKYCEGSSVGSCLPIYLSVSGITASSIRCRESACRFPNNLQYTISLENVGCSNESIIQTASVVLVLLLCALLRL